MAVIGVTWRGNSSPGPGSRAAAPYTQPALRAALSQHEVTKLTEVCETVCCTISRNPRSRILACVQFSVPAMIQR